MADDGRQGFPAGDLNAFPRITDVETPEHEALWREGVTLSAQAFAAAGRCWYCYALKVDGVCPTKGCRILESSFAEPAPKVERPCIECHALTTDWYVGALLAYKYARGKDRCPAEYIARCAACEKKRTDAQATAHREALAKIANPDYAEHFPFDANVLERDHG